MSKIVSIKCVQPNTWNPNEMSESYYRKLKHGIQELLAKAQRIPPIIVRPLSDLPKHYEIIDGFHRWRALQELGESRVEVDVLDVDDRTARILTNTLNYLKGQPDPSKYAQGIAELVESGATLSDLASWLPENEDDLADILSAADLSMTALENLKAESDEIQERARQETEDSTIEEDPWVKLEFRVSVAQAQVIEREIKRLSTQIKGKNMRGRALEYMAVQSAQTEL